MFVTSKHPRHSFWRIIFPAISRHIEIIRQQHRPRNGRVPRDVRKLLQKHGIRVGVMRYGHHVGFGQATGGSDVDRNDQ